MHKVSTQYTKVFPLLFSTRDYPSHSIVSYVTPHVAIKTDCVVIYTPCSIIKLCQICICWINDLRDMFIMPNAYKWILNMTWILCLFIITTSSWIDKIYKIPCTIKLLLAGRDNEMTIHFQPTMYITYKKTIVCTVHRKELNGWLSHIINTYKLAHPTYKLLHWEILCFLKWFFLWLPNYKSLFNDAK